VDSNCADRNEQLLLFKRAVESVRNGICITNPRLPDNPIVYVNEAFLEMTAYQRHQVIGRNCRFLQRDDRDQIAIENIREAIRTEQPITTTLRNYRRDGSIFWNELTVSPVHDERGTLINFVGVQNDISARKEAEKRVSEFYSVISHELRTPLTSINGALSVIADGSAGKVNAQVMRMVSIALENSERLIRLISDILDWKKIESGKFKLNTSNISPEQLIDNVIATVKPLASATAQSQSGEGSFNQRQSCLSTWTELMQVLTNLVDNAIKFSPVKSTVTVSAELRGLDTVRFSVVDQGEGIAPDQLDKLFKVFQQLDSSDSRRGWRNGSWFVHQSGRL
jgi:PAS domain S-box-containing protein